jgi:hypothetical protein
VFLRVLTCLIHYIIISDIDHAASAVAGQGAPRKRKHPESEEDSESESEPNGTSLPKVKESRKKARTTSTHQSGVSSPSASNVETVQHLEFRNKHYKKAPKGMVKTGKRTGNNLQKFETSPWGITGDRVGWNEFQVCLPFLQTCTDCGRNSFVGLPRRCCSPTLNGRIKGTQTHGRSWMRYEPPYTLCPSDHSLQVEATYPVLIHQENHFTAKAVVGAFLRHKANYSAKGGGRRSRNPSSANHVPPSPPSNAVDADDNMESDAIQCELRFTTDGTGANMDVVSAGMNTDAR